MNGNSNRKNSNWLARAFALAAVCAVGGGIIGAVAGLVTGRLGSSISTGIMTGSIISIALVFYLGDGSRSRKRPTDKQ